LIFKRFIVFTETRSFVFEHRTMNVKPLRLLRHLNNRLSLWGYDYTDKDDYRFLLRKVNRYYRWHPRKADTYAAELAYLARYRETEGKDFPYLPYPFIDTQRKEDIAVYRDEEKGLFYVLHNNKKLYYSRKYTTEASVRQSYFSLSLEQHPDSPHRYEHGDFKVFPGDRVVDIGAAEGNFSLDVVETAGELYIIEAEAHWMEALEATFEPWKEKVHLVCAYLSDRDEGNCKTFETIVGNARVDFTKMDVEGAELTILDNIQKALKCRQIQRIAVCTYHRTTDAQGVVQRLHKVSYGGAFSQGVMLFHYGKQRPPYFRQVLVRATAPTD
jgi:hypothetical protein